MSEDVRRRAAYFNALTRLVPEWTHDALSHLNSIATQMMLITEVARKLDADSADVREIQESLKRADNGVKRLTGLLRHQRRALGPIPERDGGPIDLAQEMTEMDALLGGSAHHFRVGWTLSAPAGPIPAEGGLDLHEALWIAAAEMLLAVPKGGQMSVRLETAGERAVLRFESSASGTTDASWLSTVRSVLEARGGGLRSESAAALELDIPVATVPR